MNRYLVRQKDYPQVSSFIFIYSRPSSDSAVGLDVFAFWRLHDMANPFIFDNRPVGPISDSLKVFRTFHRAMSFSA